VVTRTLIPNDPDNFPSYTFPVFKVEEIDQLIAQRIKLSTLKTAINRQLSDKDRQRMSSCIVEYSYLYYVDPLLTTAVIEQESGFNPKAMSVQGAAGLMQIMPTLYDELKPQLGLSNDPTDMCSNIKAGTYYLSKRIQHWDGNPYWGLVAYFAGDGGVAKIKAEGKQLYDKTGTSTQQYASAILGKLYENYLLLGRTLPIPTSAYSINFVVRFLK
jgi:soluble lytic murein transglycosylase-like protein